MNKLRLYTILVVLMFLQLKHAYGTNIDSLKSIFNSINSDTSKISWLISSAKKITNQNDENALFIFNNLKSQFELTQNVDYKVKAAFRVSEWYRLSAQYDSALAIQEKASRYVSQCTNNSILSAYYYSVLFVNSTVGNKQIANEAAMLCLKYAEASDNPERIAYAYLGLGSINFDLKDYQKSNTNFNKAIKYSKIIKRYELVAYEYSMIAGSYIYLNSIDSALYYFNQSYTIYDSLGNRPRLAHILNGMGGAYYAKGEKEKGIEYFKKAFAIKRETNDPTCTGTCYNILNYYIKVNNIDSANRYMKLAEALTSTSKDINYKLTFLEHKSEWLYLIKKDFPSAYKCYKEYHALYDSMYNANILTTTKEMEEKYQNETNARKIESLQKEQEIAELQKAKSNTIIWSMGFIILLMIIFAVYIYRNFIEKKKLSQLLAHQNAEILTQKKEITDSIEYAKRIQKSILPTDQIWFRELPNSFIVFMPKDILSGDFYWIEQADGKTIFAVADCTGHGVPGAMVSLLCAGALKSAVKEFKIQTPAHILDKVNELLKDSFQSSSEISDGMDIAICSMEQKNGKIYVEYSGANNSLWYFSNNEFHELKPTKQPIGKSDNIIPFQNNKIELQKGDTLYLFSDGYADQFGGNNGKKFMLKNLRELLSEIYLLPLNEQKEKIIATFNSWKGPIEQIDDVCLVGISV